MNLAGFSVGQPVFLWGLALCPLLVLAAFRSRVEAARWQKLLALTLRVIAVAVLVLAIADARFAWPTRELSVALVVDQSASISPAERATLRIPEERSRDVRWHDLREPPPASPSAPETLVSDLERHITTAMGVLPTDRVRRVVLATDGRETQGDVMAAADRARHAGASVYVLPMGDRPAVDRVALSGVDVPRLLRAGRDAVVSVRLYSAQAQQVQVDVARDGERITGRLVDAPAGTSLHDISIPFPDEGVHEVAVVANAQGDAMVQNNGWRSLVRVVPPPRVLLVHEIGAVTPALATVYRDAHLQVEEVGAAEVPNTVNGFRRYQFVVLDELVLTTLAPDQQRAIRAWVEERGGGLLTTTGMHGVGRLPEPLREMEPIMPPRAVREPRPIELILVLDRSGSMQGPAIINARNAASAAVRALRRDSRVGVVAFSGTPDLVSPAVSVTESEQVLAAISGIRAGGGTDLAAALNAAAQLVSNDDRYLHHVIVLSDGETRPEAAIAAAQNLRETGAVITSITLGPRSATMSTIATIGRGRYRVTRSPEALPALFVQEATFRSPPPTREGEFRPVVLSRMGFMDGVNPSQDPPLAGFVAAQPRPGALTLLATPDGGPLLGHWFFGLGQVATWASSTNGRWADAYRNGEGFRRLFSQMAWEMMKVQSEDNLEMSVDPVPGRPDLRRVSVVTPSNDSTAAPIVSLSRGRRAGVPLAVHPTAPGVWAATVALSDGFVVDARLPASLEPSVAAGAEVPYPTEFRAFGADEPMLAAIARAGGGRVIHALSEATQNVTGQRVPRDVRTQLLTAALIAYLLGILILRLPAGAFRPRVKVRTPSSVQPAESNE